MQFAFIMHASGTPNNQPYAAKHKYRGIRHAVATRAVVVNQLHQNMPPARVDSVE
jgi:hypothetical protein